MSDNVGTTKPPERKSPLRWILLVALIAYCLPRFGIMLRTGRLMTMILRCDSERALRLGDPSDRSFSGRRHQHQPVLAEGEALTPKEVSEIRTTLIRQLLIDFLTSWPGPARTMSGDAYPTVAFEFLRGNEVRGILTVTGLTGTAGICGDDVCHGFFTDLDTAPFLQAGGRVLPPDQSRQGYSKR